MNGHRRRKREGEEESGQNGRNGGETTLSINMNIPLFFCFHILPLAFLLWNVAQLNQFILLKSGPII